MVTIALPDPDFGGVRWESGGRCKSVVIAETERHITRLIQVNVERCGVLAYAAESAEGAAREIADHAPDGLITACSLDGALQLATFLREREGTRSIRILALADARIPPKARPAWDNVADLVMPKPFHPDDLLAFVAGR